MTVRRKRRPVPEVTPALEALVEYARVRGLHAETYDGVALVWTPVSTAPVAVFGYGAIDRLAFEVAQRRKEGR